MMIRCTASQGRAILILLLGMLAACSLDAAAAGDSAPVASEGETLFALKVRPLLAEKCLACHGAKPEEIKGGLDLTSREAMRRGGDTSDEVLVPGDAARSLLYIATTAEAPSLRMPPKQNDRLSVEQSRWLRDWINAGAPWPDAKTVAAIDRSSWGAGYEGTRVRTSGGLTAEWNERRYKPENLWAYRPLIRPDVPPPTGQGPPPANPVDAFLNQGLDRLGLAPAPRADRPTLIRRATFDLTGLPPTPSEVDAFVNDAGPDPVAFARVVDRLLASFHYGEQWGRHWLDVVRYADTAGLANDYERPNAWRYRDYVVRSFNRDTPYDRFVKEQVAGDELGTGGPEAVVATGFLRMGPWEHTAMSVFQVTRQHFLDDVTDAVGQAFLSQPLQCARCHDHKFDPIPTRDYYSIQAVFATTQFAEPDAPFLSEENVGEREGKTYLDRRIEEYEKVLKAIAAKTETAERAWYADRGLEYAPRQRLLKRGVSEDRIAPQRLGLTPEDFGLERIARKGLLRHRWELDRYRPIAFSVYSGKTRLVRTVDGRLLAPVDSADEGTLEATAILAGGNLASPAAPVLPGVLSALSGPTDRGTMPTTVSGRRRAFAEWLVGPGNGLSARSMVNRIWQGHFGAGIARDPNNFGSMGRKPTHPELLEWLAAKFVASGWSVKAMHRLIMASDAYARSSTHPDAQALSSKDPEGLSYARFRPRRLAAEELRDSMLAVSGELNPVPGGVPARPDLNLEVALQPRQIMGTYAPAYQPSPQPRQRHRRTIYALTLRGLRDPFLEVFNQPNLDTSCERREASTVTPQAISLFNGQSVHDRALAFAARLSREADSPAGAIRLAFRLAYGREPSPEDLGDCLDHWRRMTDRHRTLTFERRSFPDVVVRQAVDELSGEPFSFTERLEAYEDYRPDLQRCDADPSTRALADVCLVLLNANPFLYID